MSLQLSYIASNGIGARCLGYDPFRASKGNWRHVGGTLRAAGPAPARRIARCVLEGGAPAAMGRRASRRRTRTASSGTAGVGRRSLAVLAGTTGRPRSGEFHRVRPPLSADPDQSRDDGEFDRVVTVPGLTLARVQQHLDQSDGDRYLNDEYQAIVTSGYIGTQAFHVYGWDAFVTFVMQGSRWTGRRGEDPDAVLAQASATSTRHESGYFTPSAPSKAEGRYRTAPAARNPWTRLSTASTTRVLRCRLSKAGRASSGSWL